MKNSDNIPFVINLEEKYATELEIVGGKGANLAILSQRGFNVPDAFIITTGAFKHVLNGDKMRVAILGIEKLKIDDMKVLEDASNTIKSIIRDVTLPNDMTDLIMKNYNKLCEKAANMNIHVAVRSSATAEDLPDHSFAGQHDTYLHVTRENLIDRIKECWASLFTARAISYRQKSNIDHLIVKLAVVVQQMIPSDASGVSFSANPLTGLRNEVVIDSTIGLGEALVSGLVTPDHYEVLMNACQNPDIRVKIIGEKGIHIIGKSDGGIETLVTVDNDKKMEALSDEYIIQLAQLTKQIEKSYNYVPQDIEWSFFKGKFYILQARPITTLFPIPKNAIGQSGLRCMASFSTFQGFLEPFTPLGDSALRTMAGSFLRTAGANQATTIEDDISSDPSRHNIFKTVAGRIYFDVTPALTSPGRRMFGLSLWDAGLAKIINYFNSPKFFSTSLTFSSLKAHLLIVWFFIRFVLKAIRNIMFPRYAKNLFFKELEKYHQFVDKGFDDQNNHNFTDCVNHFQNILTVLSTTMIRYAFPVFIPGVKMVDILATLCKNPADALLLTRAVESNPTTEMSLILWKLSVVIRENEATSKLFENETINNLANIYKNKSFDKNIQLKLDEFFQCYGCRGVGEVDIGRQRWSDEPELVMGQIKSYLKIRSPDKAIDRIHDQSKQSAYETLSKIENELKWPFIQRPLLHFFFKRLQILFSLRECHKFNGVSQTYGKCRKELLIKANVAVNESFISKADDIFFLYIDELKSLAYDTDHRKYEKKDYWQQLILQRRAEYHRCTSYRRVPIALLSDGTTYYDASTIPDENNHQSELMEGEYHGLAVSAGICEGIVRIVDDPMNSELQPGEIMVCSATDPAWTPLFPMIGALVLETGGMVQHGAIVSREYGVPAVVGVSGAKKIFHNGQRIQVNGSTGRIKVLPD